jgi:hypothetical protein
VVGHNRYSARGMTHPSKQRKIISLKNPIPRKAAVLEYRLVWNEALEEWDIQRNGVKTGISRRKKKSAVDTAILAIQSEAMFPNEPATVVSMKDGARKTEWVSPKPPLRP